MSVKSDRKKLAEHYRNSFFNYSDKELGSIVRTCLSDNENEPYTTDDYQMLYNGFCLYDFEGKRYHPTDLLTISEFLLKYLTP